MKMSDHEDVFITITKEEYERLQADCFFLECLRNAGVDNWEGYEYACEQFNSEETD
jgi:hypothetical protein